MQIDTQKSRLENLFFNDTIDDETVANIEKMLTRKKVEKLHKYKILYNEKRDAWYTANPQDYNKRIQRKTLGELLDALKPYYIESTSTCLQDIFEEWLDYKRTITDSLILSVLTENTGKDFLTELISFRFLYRK
ncbi:hypothetical protein DXA08_17135 [Blautia obeum]|nr:hypothetical protein DXA08_17135 [Blautia obeum]